MPRIYLSPSTKDFNRFITGNTEEYYMNLIADAMIPYLKASRIDFSRNNPGDSLTRVISQSNAGGYDLHLGLYSNSAPENLGGILQGPDIYHLATSEKGRVFAEIIAGNVREIYPNPNLVQVIPTMTMNELRRTKAPAVLVELAYHDNYDDAIWMRDNIDSIGRNLSMAAAEYLDVPFTNP